MRSRFILLIFLIYSLHSQLHAQSYNHAEAAKWADSVFNTLSPKERIGQLFMVAAYSNRDSNHVNDVARLVQEYHIGGLCFFQGGPVRQAVQCNYYQSQAKVPLLISIDGEWGLSMRLDSTIRYPKQMAMGAIKDNALIYEFGKETARQCKRMGIHLNFAPVVDVNNNPKNPVINDRSFGEDKYRVAAKAIEYMEGMQDHGVMANAKHFPGHGNTDQDSHLALPLILRSQEEIDSLELYPFKELMSRGLSTVMVGHLNIPAYDTTTNGASTLSKNIVTDLLKTKLGFEGLVITDALNMKGVSSFYPPGVVDVKALLAGNDILLFAEDVPAAFMELDKAMKDSLITQTEIDTRVKKILLGKYKVGLNAYKPIVIEGLIEDLNTPEAKLMSMRLYEHAMTLLANKDRLIPFTNLEERSFAAVSVGAEINNEFLEMCKNYAMIQSFAIAKDASLNDFDFLENNLRQYNTIIVGIHDMSRRESRNFSISMQTIDFLNKLSRHKNVVVVVFGNAYSLRNFDNHAPILVAYEDNTFTRSLAAQALFGGIPVTGSLPVTASDVFKAGDGYVIEKAIRLKYTLPEEVGICSCDLTAIDRLMEKVIAEKASPGAQILIAKDGKVIYQKSFGYSDYSNTQKVRNSDLYDLASLTKILSTNMVIMEMYDKGRLDVKKKLGQYTRGLKSSYLKNIPVADLLTHRAGLLPYIPFWKESLKQAVDGTLSYSNDSSAFYAIKVADSLYLRYDFPEKMWEGIEASERKASGNYVYSDLSFYYLKRIADHYTKTGLDDYMNQFYFNPLGLSAMTYNPWKKGIVNRCMPTEMDTVFRGQLIRGYVHDPGAAMLGGVAGHAGLFANSNDVAVMMQMLLNKGDYGGRQYFKEATVSFFTNQYSPASRRALGFDKPEPDTTKGSPAAGSVSLSTFGHTGFTGTSAWADPENGIVFVFLSNRIHPDAGNRKLIQMNVRTDVQEIIYKSLPKK